MYNWRHCRLIQRLMQSEENFVNMLLGENTNANEHESENVFFNKLVGEKSHRMYLYSKCIFYQQVRHVCILALPLPCEISPELQLKMGSYVPLCTFGNKVFLNNS